ncbi:MAG TPA: ATP-binding protein [Trueperaceae bacterium]
MSRIYVFRNLAVQPWWRALTALEKSLEVGRQRGPSPASRVARRVEGRYVDLVSALISGGHASLAHAAARALLEGEQLLANGSVGLPTGLRAAALLDLELVRDLIEEPWQDRAEARSGEELPPLCGLAGAPPPGSLPSASEVETWARRIGEETPEELLPALVERYRRAGTGIFAGYLAFHWRGDELEGIARPARDRHEELVALEPQLERLTANIERFLSGRPALHTLLYGPRGSGKSTAVRGLLGRYADRGLRLVEVPRDSLASLPRLAARLGQAAHRFVLYVDDLSFESGDGGYQPLKTLLEGSLSERPGNVLLLATSNRRHLVRESLSDRPMPESDDVHGWDTTNERLALADRFGLTITFPAADQRKYLTMVRELARISGVRLPEGQLDEAAIRFAEWGNGYSGRTARQFIDTLV